MSDELKARAVCHACASQPRAWLCPVCDNELAALKAGQGEAVAYRWAWKECREDDGWTYRESPPFDPTTVVVQALYLAPPATADAVSVPREMLERLVDMLVNPIHYNPGAIDKRAAELRALLARGSEQ